MLNATYSQLWVLFISEIVFFYLLLFLRRYSQTLRSWQLSLLLPSMMLTILEYQTNF